MFTVHANCKKAESFFCPVASALMDPPTWLPKKDQRMPEGRVFCFVFFFCSVSWSLDIHISVLKVGRDPFSSALSMQSAACQLLGNELWVGLVWSHFSVLPSPTTPARLHILGHRLIKGSTIPLFWTKHLKRGTSTRVSQECSSLSRGFGFLLVPRLQSWVLDLEVESRPFPKHSSPSASALKCGVCSAFGGFLPLSNMHSKNLLRYIKTFYIPRTNRFIMIRGIQKTMF